MDKIISALGKAYEIHKGQVRKGTRFPYFVHVLDVAKILMYETEDVDIICAGILHDSLEDSHYSREQLLCDFGEKVFSLVSFCTEPGNTPDASKQEQVDSWRSRKEHSVLALKNASEEEILVYLADKVSNLQAMKEDLLVVGDELWKRFNASKEELKWYYTSIGEAIHGEGRLFSVFRSLVDEVFK